MYPDYGLKYGYGQLPNEQFLIRKFEDSPEMTARQLREEETEVFKKSLSSDSPDYHLHIRDYHRLCRGEKIVSTYIQPIICVPSEVFWLKNTCMVKQ